MKESKESKGITANLYTDFPDIFRVNQFLKILIWNNFVSFDQTKYPGYFLGIPIRKRVEKFYNRAFARSGPVEFNYSHIAS
jgi:hypothetical protein